MDQDSALEACEEGEGLTRVGGGKREGIRGKLIG